VSVLVGEANKLYLEKSFDDAIEICCEAIKIFPENPEPYHLLSVIYEELG
jgi:general transcription factor 3C polypeptide 3 (transcription factor C subunit 4)